MTFSEKPPREGSDKRKLYDTLKRGGPPEASGFAGEKLKWTFDNLVHDGFYTPDRKERRKAWLARERETHDSPWQFIEKYARLYMSPKEAEIAVGIEQGIEIDHERIRKSIRVAGATEGVPRFTKEESRETKRDNNHKAFPLPMIERRVKLWLLAASALEERKLANIPQSREDWLILIELMNHRIRGGTSVPLSMKGRRIDSTPREDLEKLWPAIKAIQKRFKLVGEREEPEWLKRVLMEKLNESESPALSRTRILGEEAKDPQGRKWVTIVSFVDDDD